MRGFFILNPEFPKHRQSKMQSLTQFQRSGHSACYIGIQFGLLRKNKPCKSFYYSPPGFPASGYRINQLNFLTTYKQRLMMTFLFILSIVVFLYLCYVLIHPEKF